MPFNNRSVISGKYFPPGDKSISHRILILTGQAIGESKIYNLLESEDVINTLKAMKILGVQINKKEKYITFLAFLLVGYFNQLRKLISEILGLELD